MTLPKWLLSSIYTIGQTSIGLLLHPYQTMQALAQEKVFSWLTLFPTALLAVLVILWRYLIIPVVRLWGSCQPNLVQVCDVLTFLSDWIAFFCIYWQVMLIYLYIRFSRAFRTLK